MIPEHGERKGAPRRVGKGRGAGINPKNRFETLALGPPEWEEEGRDPDETSHPATVYLRDTSRSILSTNDSPDVGFDASINPYRGCEHGCVYCYARPTHEYLGFSAGLDFETRILVKERAPELLRRELAAPRWRPKPLALSGVTDAYQPIERRLGITRGCLEVLAACRNPVGVVTKNHLVTRDADLLAALARHRAAVVCLSVTTLDGELARLLEPRASTPARRLAAIATLAEAGVPVGVLVGPVIPGLTDHELPAIVAAGARAGAGFAGYVMLHLPYAVKDLFTDWLARHRPDRRDKILHRIRAMRGGRLNDPRFGHRMRGNGPFAEQVAGLFALARRRAGLPASAPALSTDAFRPPPGPQPSLFDFPPNASSG